MAHHLPQLVLLLLDFLNLRFVQVSARVQALCDLIEVVGHVAQQAEHFPNLWQIQLQNVAVQGKRPHVSGFVSDSKCFQRGLYAIENNFFRFWYAFVYPYISELDAGDAEGIARHVVAPMLDSFVSHPFEDICIQYLRRQNRAEALPFHFTQIGRWWSKTEELDVFATDALHKRFLVGECKYKITPLELSDVENTLRKVPPKAGRDVSYVFFSRSGFTKGASQRIEELGGMAVSEEQLLCNSIR